MQLIIIFVIAIAVSIFVIYPLMSSRDEDKSKLPVDVTAEADLKRRRMVVYENMQDLEFEFQAKKIGLKDYESLRENYKTEAAKLMAASQELERGTAEDRFIEREVAARRARLKNKLVETYVCSQCGFNNPVPVKFCGNCGSPVTPGRAPAGSE